MGKDLPAGEYRIVATSNDPAFLIQKELLETPTVRKSDIQTFNGSWITELKEGEYITLQQCRILVDPSFHSISSGNDGDFPPGTYKIGQDLPPGTYVIQNGPGQAIHTVIKNGSYAGKIALDYYEQLYLTKREGETVYFSNGRMYPEENAPIIKLPDASIPPGMYLVGKDIPEGKYTLTSSGSREDGACNIERAKTGQGENNYAFTSSWKQTIPLSLHTGDAISFYGCDLSVEK